MTDKVVIVPRGIPGSGKTTWVSSAISGYEKGTAVRINNDDLVAMLLQPWQEYFFSDVVTNALADLRIAMLRVLLSQERISDIYIDNTNLSIRTVSDLEKVALEMGARFVVVDHFLNEDVEECIARDAKRERTVGEAVIRKMHKDAQRLKPWKYKDYPNIQPYDNDPNLPRIVLVDVDGTVAIKHPDRDVYDASKAHMDFPNIPVVTAVRALLLHGEKIVVMSGRSEDCRDETYDWLERNLGYWGFPLYMRKSGDTRPDWIVKHELFQEHIAGKHSVLAVFDDRDQVVNLWRRRLMLPTFQVADGDF